MSSDISHSMSKILPVAQNLLPVCLKRKLEYTGNYIEEVIDRNKVNAYFNFFKKYNPLFNSIDLEESKIDQYEYESTVAAEEFDEAINKMDADKQVPDEEMNCNVEENSDEEKTSPDSDSESSTDEFDPNLNTYFNPEIEKENEDVKYFRDESSVFCNKYEEDMNSRTVTNRLANLIVEAEIYYNIEIDDEIDKEEVDDSNLELSETENEVGAKIPEDEFLNDEKFFQEILEFEADKICKQASSQISSILKKIEKIQVAPGEKGKFKNWGEDVFLEEKAFPELFPFGVGGYFSSLVNNKENDMGFANYVKHIYFSF